MSIVGRVGAVAAVAILAVALLAWPASADDRAAGSGEPAHCAAILQPSGSSAAVAAPAVRCFGTIAESVAYATDGAIRLSPGQRYPTAAQAAAAGRNSAASVLLGIEYGDRDFTGSTLSLSGTSGTGCYNGVSYGFASLPSGWNDEISSSKAYSNCHGWHYEHTYSGAVLICQPNCRSFSSAMNDETSSIVFKR